MASNSVIILGASGSVASATAAVAKSEGADVYLASRNPDRAGTARGANTSGSFKTAYADLSKPETVRDAVQSTGAKRAFLYMLMTATDAMRGVISALKEGGIEFVVFLSSYQVQGDREKQDPGNFIAVKHAAVEVVLEEVFGLEHYAALRPGYFATNAFNWKPTLASGEAKIPFADAVFDWIDERDIGTIAGRLLAGDHPEILQALTPDRGLPLAGAELLSQGAAAQTIADVLGKTNFKVTPLTMEEGMQFYVTERGIPPPMAKNLMTLLKERTEAGENGQYEQPMLSKAQDNVAKLTGKKPTIFKKWVEDHQQEFQA